MLLIATCTQWVWVLPLGVNSRYYWRGRSRWNSWMCSLGWRFHMSLKCQSPTLRQIIPLRFFFRKITLIFSKRIHFKLCGILKNYRKICINLGFPCGSTVKTPPAMQEICIQPLGREDPLEQGTATHSSVLAWRIPWTGEPGGPQAIGPQRVRHDWSDLACAHT